MIDDLALRRLLAGLLAAALLAPAAAAEAPLFTVNEMRAAAMKDRLRGVSAHFKDATAPALRLSKDVTEAFKDVDDWAPAAEAFYARKNELSARAAALEVRLDRAVVRNAPQQAVEVKQALDELEKTARVLRSDYDFYTGLPRLAAGAQRKAAQAAMRMLGQTGDYTLTLAYFLDKTPGRPPFAPLAPGVMYIRHR